MADLSKTPEIQQLVAAAVAEATKQLQAQHLQAIEVLKAAASKSAEQKRAEEDCERARTKQRELRDAARLVATESGHPTQLKYVAGPSGHYGRGRHYLSGQVVTVPNSDDPKDLPSIEWTVYDRRALKAVEPEKRGPLSASEMNKLDAERPKTGVQAPKKGGRPSDTEV